MSGDGDSRRLGGLVGASRTTSRGVLVGVVRSLSLERPGDPGSNKARHRASGAASTRSLCLLLCPPSPGSATGPRPSRSRRLRGRAQGLGRAREPRPRRTEIAFSKRRRALFGCKGAGSACAGRRALRPSLLSFSLWFDRPRRALVNQTQDPQVGREGRSASCGPPSWCSQGKRTRDDRCFCVGGGYHPQANRQGPAARLGRSTVVSPRCFPRRASARTRRSDLAG